MALERDIVLYCCNRRSPIGMVPNIEEFKKKTPRIFKNTSSPFYWFFGILHF